MLRFPAISMLSDNFIPIPVDLRLQRSVPLNLYPSFVHSPNPITLFSTSVGWRVESRKRSRGSLKLPAGNQNCDMLPEESVSNFDQDDQQEGENRDGLSPWKGAVIYKRNASVLHIEHCTTLERLGLGKLSTEVSKMHASMMGLRVTKAVKDYRDGTPALVSLDVTRKKRRLRLDGILRTVITLGCNRCGEPAAKPVFSNFSLLLTEEPVEEPEMIQMHLSREKEKLASGSPEQGGEDDDEDDSIDLDDRLYFPFQEKEIDISKHIRDLIHVEITIAEVCDPKCKGLCLKCGVNLNNCGCKCEIGKVEKKGYGPLGSLRKQLQQK